MRNNKLILIGVLGLSLAPSVHAGWWWSKNPKAVEIEKLEKALELERNRNRALRDDNRALRNAQEEIVEGKAEIKVVGESKRDTRREERAGVVGASLPEVLENGLEQVIQHSKESSDKIIQENKFSRQEIESINKRLTLVEEKNNIVEQKEPFKARSINLMVKDGAKPIYAFRANGQILYRIDLIALDRLFSSYMLTSIKYSAIDFLGEKVNGSPFTPQNFRTIMMENKRDEDIRTEIRLHSLVSKFYVEVSGIDEINRPFTLSGFLPVEFDGELNWIVCEKIGDDYAFKKGGEGIAASFYHRALSLDASNPILCQKLASALNGMGEFEKAVLFFQRSLAIDPKNSHALENYATCLANLNTKINNELILKHPLDRFIKTPQHSYHETNKDRASQIKYEKEVRRDSRINDEVSFYERYAE